ncbi:MAG TPA: cytochrome C [Ignavibacteriales bacterium]|nr:cytochrome C [Ignavibacteriales bacterium]
MKNHKFRKNIIWGIIISILIIFSQENRAIPSFAHQTNLPCSSCHTIFPELNTFGRFFKLNGYTLIGVNTIEVNDTTDKKDDVDFNLLKIPPVSLMIQAAYTYKTKEQPATQNNNVSFPQQLSIFFGGEIAPHLGSFIQVSYDDQEAAFGIDNIDLRYANQTELGSENLLYGVTVNNNPTAQDLWNSTPAWGFPYASSSVTASPLASTLIEGGLAQSVAGMGAYALLNNFLYAEFSIYRSAQQGGAHPPDNTSFGIIKTLAPYWRLAFQKQFDDQYFEIGTFGMSTEMYPAGISGLTDRYNDFGFDINYEKSLGDNQLTAHTSFILEKRNFDATFNSNGSLSQSLNLNSFKIVGNYYLQQQFGFTLGYFSITGDGDAVLYAPTEFSGSSTGVPDSRGFITEIDYLPWLNTKFSVQYVAYNKFNGSGDNYDGAGRNASDNNSFYLLAWLAF